MCVNSPVISADPKLCRLSYLKVVESSSGLQK